MHSFDIVGYVYKADVYHPTCVVEEMIERGQASPAARDMCVEDALDMIADANCINRMDECTFDSGDFPKVIFADEAGHLKICGRCGDWLCD